MTSYLEPILLEQLLLESLAEKIGLAHSEVRSLSTPRPSKTRGKGRTLTGQTDFDLAPLGIKDQEDFI